MAKEYSQFLIILFLLVTNTFAQDKILINHLTVESGLSNNQVHCIIQDRYGFLWIGTNDGLNRYDGYEFIVYRNNVWDTTSLSSPMVYKLVEDKNGNIWIGTPSGLNFYDRQSDSFKRYTHNSENSNTVLENDNIISLLLDKTNSNYLWIGTDGGGLTLLDISLQRFYMFKHDTNNLNSLSGNKIYSLYQDSFKYLWIGTSDAGMNKLNLDLIPKTNSGKYDTSKFSLIKFIRFEIDKDTSSTYNPRWVNSFYEDRSNRIWILGDSRILTFDRKKNVIVPLPYSYKNIDHYHEMIEDKEGNYWFGQHNRVFELIDGKNNFIEYRLNKEVDRSESNQGLLEDKNGNIWVGTWDGIYKIYKEAPLFEHYVHNPDNSTTPPNNNIYSFLDDHLGHLWIGTDSGLLLMVNEGNGHTRFINYFDLHKLEKERVESLVQDRNGSIWLTSDYTLLRIDPQNNAIFKYENSKYNSNSLSFQNKLGWSGATNLLIDDSDNLWIAAYRGGISKVRLKDLYSTNDLGNVLFTNYFYDSDQPACTVLDFIQDRNGYLWICSQNGGVFMFDPETEIFKNYTQDLNNYQGLSINYVSSVREDNNGNLWFGTYGGGLNRFDRDRESFNHYTTKDGLAGDIISNILVDKNGNLWMSTNSGITKFNLDKGKLRNYHILENQVAYYDSVTDKMYFGNENGFIVFDPDSIKENDQIPPVLITKFIRFSDENDGNQIIDRTISVKDNISLSYKDDILSFEFAALSFDPDLKFEYSYILEGFNNNWINIGSKRNVTFTNLDPGNYNFKVKACNEDGKWCADYASIKFFISPPWWSTAWAYFGYGILFISVLYGIRRYELNRRKEKEDRRILEIENKRKTKELEQARKLQLSMLPKEIPTLPNLDIAAYMRTATEVGGDYYDFYLNEEGMLTTIIGDATGHGLNAGMLVSVTKGIFQNLASQSELEKIISQFNTALISMELQPMYMSLALTRITNNRLQLVGAGMPPFLYYQSKSGVVTEIESSGPPLGGFPDFNYKVCEYELSTGDIIIMMSDGFAERRNANKEIYGWERGKELLSITACLDSEKIIKKFVKAGYDWGGDRQQDDDITILVFKVK